MNEALRKRLRQLRLSGLADALDVRLQEAAGHNLSHLEFLEAILQDEVDVRQQRQMARRRKQADFRETRTLEDFDFAFNPSIKRKLVYDLAAGQFIREARDALPAGPPASAKATSHRPSATRPSGWASRCSIARSSIRARTARR